MVGEQRRFFVLHVVCAAVLLAQGSQAINLKAGKTNVTVKSPGLFACDQTITFAEPFSGGKQVKVFASFGHSVNNKARGNGAAIWVESADRTQFRACIYEYSNAQIQVPRETGLPHNLLPKAEHNYVSLPWTLGLPKCKKDRLSSECQNYGSLNSGTRRTSNVYGYYCDNGLGPGWFRFQGSAGTRIATSCPSYRRCGTYASGWLSGGHPSVADGQVTRTVYFNDGYCYSYSKRIKVRNCGSYYVYYLSGTPTCNLRYCGTN